MTEARDKQIIKLKLVKLKEKRLPMSGDLSVTMSGSPYPSTSQEGDGERMEEEAGPSNGDTDKDGLFKV